METLGSEGMIPKTLADSIKVFAKAFEEWKTLFLLRQEQIDRGQSYEEPEVLEAEKQRLELEQQVDALSSQLSRELMEAFGNG